MVEITQRFIEMPEFQLGLEKPYKIYGIGEFGFQSYLIFCKGAGLSLTPTDKNLRSFVNWQRQNFAREAAAPDIAKVKKESK